MITREQIGELDVLYNYMDGELVLGYLEIRSIDGIIDVMNIFVNEDHRREGIATKLFKKMFNSEEYSKIMLEVNENNESAIKLYTKLGFKEISFRDRYYKEDTALIMEKVKE